MTDQELLDLAARCGFDHVGPMNVEVMRFEPAVRDMCAADRCRSYGRCWTWSARLWHAGGDLRPGGAAYRRGVLLQSTGQMEDDFDVEAMMDTERLQKERFRAFVDRVREEYPNCLPMSSGACSVCPACTYPDAPCRFPHLAIPSMEAYGLVVSQVCQDSGLPYYYGPRTITYTACVLVD